MGSRTITLAWDHPILTGSSDLVGYYVSCSNASFTSTVAAINTCSFSGLLPATTYSFSIYSYNATQVSSLVYCTGTTLVVPVLLSIFIAPATATIPG